MNEELFIAEITKETDLSNPKLISKQVKITNTSNLFINDIKLIIDEHQFPIYEESIIRERGSLILDSNTQCIELGNLAPQESAYFEYKFLAPNNIPSLTDYLSIAYTSEATNKTAQKKIVDYLPTTSTPLKES